jgi:pilus assembly protein CpaE
MKASSVHCGSGLILGESRWQRRGLWGGAPEAVDPPVEELQASTHTMIEIHTITRHAGRDGVTVALLGAGEEHRQAVAAILAKHPGLHVHEYASFPAQVDELAATLAQQYDVVFLDADGDTEYALELTQSVSARGRVYVMVYSAQNDMRLAVRFMRAGAREFLAYPLDAAEVDGALARVSLRQAAPRQPVRKANKLLVFLGAKGGCGVTTMASNFALALADESGSSTLLIDLGQPLGDVAINLGMTTQYSVLNALEDPQRLDANFLASLVTKHNTGLQVLAAPREFPSSPPPKEALSRLVTVARQNYEYVVVDAGSRVELIGTPLFEQASIVYLITQVGISELRNANRMISRFFAARGNSLQIVVNRYTPKMRLFDDEQINKALTRPAQWKIPDDYATARRTRETATPMVLLESGISNAIREMARAAADLPADGESKRGLFKLFL